MKLKTWNKGQALDKLGQYLKLFVQEVHHEHSGNVTVTLQDQLHQALAQAEAHRNGHGVTVDPEIDYGTSC